MIRHAVLCNFRKDLKQSDIDALFAALHALKNQIPGIVAISHGKDNSPEGLQKGKTHGFTVDFIDAAARDAYLPHPAHQKVGAMVVAAAEGGLAGITVVDWEMA
jgi:hypothetical protein